MVWFLLALGSALSWATTDVFSKSIASKLDDYVSVAARFAFAAPFTLLLLFFIEIPSLSSVFWMLVIAAALFEFPIHLLYIYALRIADLSLVAPLVTFTPVFLLLTSWVMLGEFPTLLGLVGILLVVIGAYVLHAHHNDKSLLAPIISIFTHKGSLAMIIAAFLFSITSNLGKILIHHSSAWFMAAIYLPLVAIPLVLLAFVRSKKNMSSVLRHKKAMSLSGFFWSLQAIFHFLAIQSSIVPYVIAIKRTSSLFSVGYGALLFKEKQTARRLIAAAIMVVGAAVIVVLG